MHQFLKLFLKWNSTCFGQFLCPSSGVLHCTHGNGICHTGLLTTCEQDQDGAAVPFWSCSQAVSKPVWHIPLPCVQWRTPDHGQRNYPKHVEFHSKNKFEKLVHLFGFTIRNIGICLIRWKATARKWCAMDSLFFGRWQAVSITFTFILYTLLGFENSLWFFEWWGRCSPHCPAVTARLSLFLIHNRQILNNLSGEDAAVHTVRLSRCLCPCSLFTIVKFWIIWVVRTLQSTLSGCHGASVPVPYSQSSNFE